MTKPYNYPKFYPFTHAYSKDVTGVPIVIVDVPLPLWDSTDTLTGLGGWTYWFLDRCRGRVFHEHLPKDNVVRHEQPSRFYFELRDEADRYVEGYTQAPTSRLVFPRLPLEEGESMQVAGVMVPTFSNALTSASILAYMWYLNQAKSKIFTSDDLLIFTDIDDLAAFKLKFG